MNELKSGMLVQHASLGLGKVVAVETDAVHVFFDANDSRFASKLRLPMAAPLLRPTAAENAWLAATAPFTRDARSGRYALAQSWVGERASLARFAESHPAGFAEAPAEKAEKSDKRARAPRWRAAQETFAKLLGDGEGEKLLEKGRLDDLVERALRVERDVTVLHAPSDKAALATALSDPSACADYFAALFASLAEPAPTKAAFEALAAAAVPLPRVAPGSAWVAATLLPAIAQPDRHAFLRPKATCEAAHRLGFDLKYDAAPNWRTYAALLAMSRLVLDAIRPLGARDHVDVDSFVHGGAVRRAGAVAARGSAR